MNQQLESDVHEAFSPRSRASLPERAIASAPSTTTLEPVASATF